MNTGINFDKYDDIPVEVTGEGAPSHIETVRTSLSLSLSLSLVFSSLFSRFSLRFLFFSPVSFSFFPLSLSLSLFLSRLFSSIKDFLFLASF